MLRNVIFFLLTAAFLPGCKCPTVAGPTAPVVNFSGTLAPAEARSFDAETPDGTTQVNLTVSWTPGLEVWQVDASCPVDALTSCPRLQSNSLPTGPPLASTISMVGRVVGSRIRIVLRNALLDAPLNFTLSMAPRKAGCG